MLSTTPSSISSFAGPSPSASTAGRRSRLSNSLLTSGSKRSAGVSATPTSRKYYSSNPSRSFDDSSALPSGHTTPSEHGGGSGPSSSSMSTSFVPRRVYVSDQELCFRANQVHNSLDFDALTNLTINTWAWKENHREFTLFAMDAKAERRHEVLAAGDLNCSIEELVSILHLVTVPEYNATMKRLLKKDFIYGSIVHAIGPASPQSSSSPMTPGALDACSSSSVSGGSGSLASSSAGSSSSSNSMGNYVAVKTSTFVRSNLFARNEEWCFLESFERSPEGDNFLLSQSTIDAEELRAGKASHSRVDQLRDVTTAFYVEKTPRTRGAVRLFFHGKYDGGLNSYMHTKGVAPPKAVKSRLMTLAKGVSRISDLVRRRRLGLQKMANHTAFNAVKNTKCTCCTKGLHLFIKKKRCFLCAYYVCDKCWTQQKMETCNGKTSSILICTRCLECVDACEYSDVCSQDRKKHLIRVEPDDGGSGRSQNKSNNNSKQPAGKALVDILEQSLGDPDELIKSAAMSVIRHILKQDSFEDVNNEEGYYHKSSGSFSTTTRPSMMIRDDGLQSERDHVEALAKCFELESPPPLHECVLANAELRNYPIRMPTNPATTTPEYPMPENEAQRLHAIQENNFANLGEVAELNIICTLAAEALHCAISMITVIDKESELILACNNLDLHRTSMPRNQAFCSHLIMDNKPLLIRHPEADVRFHNMDAVTKNGVRFYCGFPLVSQDGTVVGSVCCLDFEQRSLTQSQYSMMQTLAKTASKVTQAKGRALSGRKTMGGGGAVPTPPWSLGKLKEG